MKFFNILIFFGFTLILKAENIQEANNAYKQGNYLQTIAIYEKITKVNSNNSDLYYNLGNAYFKNNNLGKAILNYEKSLKINYNNDAAFNLKIANSKIIDKIEKVDTTFFREKINAFINDFTLNFWTFSLILSWFIVCLTSIFFVFNINKKLNFFVALIFLFISIVLFFITSSRKNKITDNDYGIVIVSETKLKSAPNNNANNIATVHEGLKVFIENENKGFYQIVLDNNIKAWIQTTDIERI